MTRSLPRARALARKCGRAALVAGALLALLLTQPVINALSPGNAVLDEARNYDRRIAHNRDFKAPDRPLSVAGTPLAAVRELSLTRDDEFGTVRTVSSAITYLTGARPGEDPMQVALDFVSDPSVLDVLGLTAADL